MHFDILQGVVCACTRRVLPIAIVSFASLFCAAKPIDPATIRGIHNPGSLCYYNADLMALAGSPAFRDQLHRQSHSFARKLSAVLDTLAQPGPSLSHTSQGVLREFDQALSPYFCHVINSRQQQDASECLLPILNNAFRKNPIQFSLVSRQKRAQQDQLCNDLYIPSIDRPIDPTSPEWQTTIVPVNIPEGSAQFSLQSFFSGFTLQEDVYISEKKILSIPTFVQHVVFGNYPPVLPIYIVRFTATGKKNLNLVEIPRHLTVPGYHGTNQKYILRSVVIHSGGGVDGGHYYVCFPDPISTDRWVVGNDSAQKKIVSWGMVRQEVLTQATICLYDIEDSSCIR